IKEFHVRYVKDSVFTLAVQDVNGWTVNTSANMFVVSLFWFNIHQMRRFLHRKNVAS
ncbi:4160_t:CDS:1, partial [Dentiscutata heterogama]